jgi:twinkle protein
MAMNDWVLDNSVDFSKYLKESEQHQRVKDASVWIDELESEIESPIEVREASLPWTKTLGRFGMRPGEVTLWAGQNGSGKSLITGLVGLSLVGGDHRIGIQSFEMKPKRSLSRMIRQFHCNDIEHLSPDFKRDVYRRFREFAMGKVFFYDQQGTVRGDQVISVSRYMAKELGITHIFVDSVMKVVEGEDDYNGQKLFVDEMCALARDLNIHIHLVHHIRKGQSDEQMPDKVAIKGTGAIADQVDNIMLVYRNKKKERTQQSGGFVEPGTPDAVLMCEKQRNGESEDWLPLWFDRPSMQYIEREGGVPMLFGPGQGF